MPDYGWAYINLDVLKSIEGPDITGSIAIIKDPYTLSGSKHLAYDTASNKVGIGLNFPTVLPAYQLDVSASAGQTTAAKFHGDVRITGSAFVSGTLKVETLSANTVISSSHLIVRDPIIGLGFGDGTDETGSVGDRGFIFGLAGDLNQAIIWDQTSGSFVIGKVGAAGPDADAFDIPTTSLSTVKAGALTVGAITGSDTLEIAGDITGSDTLYVDSTNKRVGIGTATPAKALHIGDASDTSGNGTIRLQGYSAGGSGNYHQIVSEGDNLEFLRNTTSCLFLKYDGNVGMGTNNPTDKLTVVGGMSGSSTLKIGGATTGSDTLYADPTTNRVGVNAPLPSGDFHVKSDGNDALLVKQGNVSIGTTDTNAQLYVNAENDNMFQVRYDGGGGTECLFVSGSGFVGIGTTEPAYELDVVGNIGMDEYLYHNGDADTYLRLRTNIANLVAGGMSAIRLETSTGKIQLNNGNEDLDVQMMADDGEVILHTDAATNRAAIGTVTPTALLHLSQSTTTANQPIPLFKIEDGFPQTGNEQGQPIFVVTSSNPDNYAEGRVGINIARPSGALHIRTKLDGGQGANTLVVYDKKVSINSPNPGGDPAMFFMYNKGDDDNIFRITNVKDADDSEHRLFEVTASGNTGVGKFGSGDSLSTLFVSGSSMLTDVTCSVGISASIGHFATLTIDALAGGTINNSTIGITTPSYANFTEMITGGFRAGYSGSISISPYAVVAGDYILGIDTTSNAVEVDLRAASDAKTGRMLIIKDVGGNAGTNNITIDPNGSEKIDGQANLVIAANSGSATIFCDGNNWFVAGTR